MVTDWSKPIEFLPDPFSNSKKWVPARVLSTDIKGYREQTLVAFAWNSGGLEYVSQAPKDATYLRNVPEPKKKKKVWDVTFRNTKFSLKTFDYKPEGAAPMASGKLYGMQGWQIATVTEREVEV